MAAQEVLVRLRALGAQAFQREMDRSAKSVKGVGDEAAKAEPGWKQSGKTLLKWAGGAAAIYGAKRGLEASVNATQDLAKATMAIQRGTGLDTKTASEWATVTKARGIQTKQFQIGLVALSRQLAGAQNGAKKATATLKQLGISQDVIAKGDVSGAIMQTADAFQNMTDPAQKAALAQQLFGRQGQTLLPLLNSGSKGIQEQLGLADKYGAVLSDKTAGGAKDLIARQREMKIAQDGLKVSIGTALMPVMLSFSQVLLRVTQILQPLLRDSTLLKVVIVAVTLAFTAYKVAIIASTIATLSFNAAILLIPLAVIAVGAAFVIAYKKVGWFRDAVNAVFGWIKSNWPLLVAILTGPFGTAVLLIIRNFGKIKKAASDTVSWIAGRFRDLIAFFRRLPGAIIAAIGDLGGKLKSKFEGLKGGGVPFVPGIQHGGHIIRSGMALVGEAGPELVRLPRAATVLPLTQGMPAGALAGATATTAHFYLDRRLVATAVAQAGADQKARR